MLSAKNLYYVARDSSYILHMNARVSKVTAKALTSIPKTVREKLRLRPGDVVRYLFQRKRVIIKPASGAENDPFATFTEWASEADEEAYRSL